MRIPFVAWRPAMTRAAAAMAVITSLAGCAVETSPASMAQVAGFAAGLNEEIKASALPMPGRMTMHQAVARAIETNLALRARALEAALTEARVNAGRTDMLPRLVAESAYFERDPAHASRSSRSPEHTTSSDSATLTRDMAASWNVLDFGLSYVRAEQGMDKAHRQREEARRVAARIAEDTRAAFWRAVASEKLGPALMRLSREVRNALKQSRRASQDILLDPLDQINFQRDMLELQRELNQLNLALAGSGEELKHLVNHQEPGRLELDDSGREALAKLPSSTATDDIAAALEQRPEVRQHIYDLRITASEADAAVLEVLPGITLDSSWERDSNSYLLHASWASWGTRIAGNLVKLATVDDKLGVLEDERELHRRNALATAAAIVMQVHVARARAGVHMRAWRDAEEYARLQRQLLSQVRATVVAGKAGRQALTREKLATLLADVRSILAFADLQAALASYESARGDEPFGSTVPRDSGAPRIAGAVTETTGEGATAK